MFDLSYYHGILTSTAELLKEDLSVEDEKTLFEYYHMLVEKPVECFPIEIDNYENELELEAYEVAISIARFLKDSNNVLIRSLSFTSIFNLWALSNYNYRWIGFTERDIDLIIIELKKILPLMDISINFKYDIEDILYNVNGFNQFCAIDGAELDEALLIKLRNQAIQDEVKNLKLLSADSILRMIKLYIKNNAKMIEVICEDYHDANVFYLHHEKDGYYRFNQNYFEEVKNKMSFWSRLYMEYANPDIYGEDDDLPEIYEEEGD